MSNDARDARGLHEDGFHEIQLSGKQLVFLFMATTVVSIVIFLCGVLVGRGVRAEGAVGEASAPAIERTAELVPVPSTPAQKADTPPPVEEPTPTTEDLSYYDRLGAAAPAAERVAPAAGGARGKGPENAAKAAPPAAAPAPAASATPAPANRSAVPAGPPSGSGRYTVQVAAVRTRAEADTIARRLTSRGYPAYVDSSSGRRTMYRVRVGAFPDRSGAEPVRQRLEKEEKFKPWVTTR